VNAPGTDTAAEAEKRFLDALEAVGARDPREFYRERLKELKQVDAAGYEATVVYYRESLIPSVASGEADPLGAWLEYGRVIVAAIAEGHTVEIDGLGRRAAYSPPTPRDRLVLHLPAAGGRALLVGLPTELTDAQRASFDLLVRGKLKLQGV